MGQPNYYLKGKSKWKEGRCGEAISSLRTFINIEPENAKGHNLLAWILATCPMESLRDGPLAVRHAQIACQLTDYKIASYLDTLAASHARNGSCERAVEVQRHAIQLLKISGQIDRGYEARLQLYSQNRPYETPQDLPRVSSSEFAEANNVNDVTWHDYRCPKCQSMIEVTSGELDTSILCPVCNNSIFVESAYRLPMDNRPILMKKEISPIFAEWKLDGKGLLQLGGVVIAVLALVGLTRLALYDGDPRSKDQSGLVKENHHEPEHALELALEANRPIDNKVSIVQEVKPEFVDGTGQYLPTPKKFEAPLEPQKPKKESQEEPVEEFRIFARSFVASFQEVWKNRRVSMSKTFRGKRRFGGEIWEEGNQYTISATGRYEIRDDYSIDVKRNDSLITPYIGLIKFYGRWHINGLLGIKEEIQTEWKSVIIEFGYRNGKWEATSDLPEELTVSE